MERRERLSHNKAEPPVASVAAGDLRREGQKLLVQEALRVKVAHQTRPALDENPLAATDATHFVEDSARRNRACAATNRAYLDRTGRTLLAQALRARGRRNINAGTFPDANTGKRRSILPLPLTMTFSGIPRLRSAFLSCRYSLASSGQIASAVQTCSGSAESVPEPMITTVGNGAQQAHHHAILSAESADVAPLACPFALSETTPSRVVTKLL
jgi:hypothetical protein